MLTKLEGVYFGDLDGKRVIIIDPTIADQSVMKIVDDFLIESRTNDGRRNNQRRIEDQIQEVQTQ